MDNLEELWQRVRKIQYLRRQPEISCNAPVSRVMCTYIAGDSPVLLQLQSHEELAAQ